MTTTVVGGGRGEMGEDALNLTSKDSSPLTSTDTTTTMNGTTTTADEPVIQSPDSAIGVTPPTSTPDQEYSTITTATTTTTTTTSSGRERDGGRLKATDSQETPEETSSDEEGYEEDDEGGVEEEELSPEEEEEEEEEEVVVSASMQFPLAKKASPSGCESDIEDNDEEEEAEEDRIIDEGEEKEDADDEKNESRKEDAEGTMSEKDKKDILNSTAASKMTPATMDPSTTAASPTTVTASTADSTTPADASTTGVVHLPDTVTRLDTPEGSAVYLVGTAHFSRESQEDVANTIRTVKPDVVVVELCKARTAILQLDEETILQESRSLDLKKVQMIVRQHGKIQGVLYLLLLSVSAHITKQLGMAPGGEFRTAFAEARRSAPGCLIQLGDRPIQVTLSRALASLSLWHKIKLTWHILTSKEPISKEEVEKCKQRDFILEMLAEMTGQFPAISEVFVKERDVYLCRSLQIAAQPAPNPHSPTGQSPRVVVGVVGIGHVPGIVELWGKVTDADITPIMRIPPPTLSSRLLKLGFRASLYGLVGFGIYRCLPRSAQSSIHTSIHSTLSSAASTLLPAGLWGK